MALRDAQARTTRLGDYRPPEFLIDRTDLYFDLRPGRSFARYLSAQGIPCLLLDWGEPGSVESAFACAESTPHLALLAR